MLLHSTQCTAVQVKDQEGVVLVVEEVEVVAQAVVVADQEEVAVVALQVVAL